MKTIACILCLAILTGCGFLNDANRRYSCRVNDDCAGDNQCLGVVEITPPDNCITLFGGSGYTEDGGSVFADGGKVNTDGGIPILDEGKCYLLYCTPPGPTDCGGKTCAADSDCVIAMTESGQVYLACVGSDLIDDNARCDDLTYPGSECQFDTTGKVCVLVFSRYTEEHSDTFTDFKRCVPHTELKEPGR